MEIEARHIPPLSYIRIDDKTLGRPHNLEYLFFSLLSFSKQQALSQSLRKMQTYKSWLQCLIFFFFSSLLCMCIAYIQDGSTAADVRNHKDVGSASVNNKLITSTATTGPSFDKSLPLNVTVQYGAHAHLVCRVQDVANKSVNKFCNAISWSPVLLLLLFEP